MTLSTREEQLLNAVQDLLDQAENSVRASRRMKKATAYAIADSIRSANYLVYLVLKPEVRLINDVRNGRKE